MSTATPAASARGSAPARVAADAAAPRKPAKPAPAALPADPPEESGASGDEGSPAGSQEGSEASTGPDSDTGSASGSSSDVDEAIDLLGKLLRKMGTARKKPKKPRSYYEQVVAVNARRGPRPAPAGLPITGRYTIFRVPTEALPPGGKPPASPVLNTIYAHVYSTLYFVERDLDILQRTQARDISADQALEFGRGAMTAVHQELLDIFSFIRDTCSSESHDKKVSRMRRVISKPLDYTADTERDRLLAKLQRKAVEKAILKLYQEKSDDEKGKPDRRPGRQDQPQSASGGRKDSGKGKQQWRGKKQTPKEQTKPDTVAAEAAGPAPQ